MIRLRVHDTGCQCHLFLDANKSDPTGTKGVRMEFEKKLISKFKRIKALINQAIVQNDVLGLKKNILGDSARSIITDAAAPPPKAFAFSRSAEKVDQFMAWLRAAEDEEILQIMPGANVASSARNAWTNTYIDTAYQKGIRDAGAKLKKGGASVADSWVRNAFNRPIHADRLGLAYTRTFTDLNGITQAMDQQISRILAQGIGEGRGPIDIARDLAERVDKIGIARAKVLARTEVVDAHAQATLNAFEEAGIEGVEVEAEVINGSDPCPICEDLAAGGPYTISEARGLIPAHPQCVCAWNPKVVNGSGIDLI